MEVVLLKPAARIPRRQTPGAAGYDLHASENICIYPGKRALVSTGLAIALPHGVYGRIAPRSSLAVKSGIQVGAGVIDADYRGEIKVLLFNHSKNHQFQVNEGDRIAQLICEKYETPEIIQFFRIDDLSKTDRGEGGFGSTGVGNTVYPTHL
jgi:dUTP pyrophosphatase